VHPPLIEWSLVGAGLGTDRVSAPTPPLLTGTKTERAALGLRVDGWQLRFGVFGTTRSEPDPRLDHLTRTGSALK
jgi:hypothetical protein